jgi:UDP-N-acetylmuramoyl-L-alanyl-D-glutamate--2,6-diaminopimelate ligase
MEVSSHALDQGRVDAVAFKVAVFTNLTRDHLDYHGDMAEYGQAKARLFAWPTLRTVVINLDDAFGAQLHDAVPADVRRIGVSSRGAAAASLRALAPRLSPAGLQFRLAENDEAHDVASPLLGRFNIDNLLAVAGTLLGLGWPLADVAAMLPRLSPVDGRMSRAGGRDGQPLVVVDYAHTPDALEQALSSLREHTPGRLTCVFGCGGDRDRGKRAQMATIAERGADRVIVTDDNPRSEPPAAIRAEILAGAPGAREIGDRADAIRAGARLLGNGDVLLVAGKGHETGQIVGSTVLSFSDHEAVREALAEAPINV